LKSSDVRSSFIDYFADRGHVHAPSAPLVPHGDVTLLFTNAGMVQFKNYFVGAESPPYERAVTAQKCMRVSGKHNDLENVGPSPRHHTFFEMLGNFSFGDYFKDEAIRFGWELVTEGWGIPAERLFATVYEEDDEAEALWLKISGLAPERVKRCGKKDNFWSMGDTGPNGPCSEIFVDMHPELPHVDWAVGSENGRYLEIWNLVFMQFDTAADGTVSQLPNPSIDTGAGLERVAAVLQGVESNYDSDLFRPLLEATSALAGRQYGASADDDVSMRVIADHLRAVSFLLADGVIPSNEGRGYVLRRILRRAVRHGMNLGFEEPFLKRLVPVVGEVLGAHYAELSATQSASVETVEAEESKFLTTVATASQQVQSAIDAARADGRDTLDGATVFRFYDTHGLPVELIREIAEEERFSLDESGFETALEEQRTRSRSAGGSGTGRRAAASAALDNGAAIATDFVGYQDTRVEQSSVESLARREGEDEWLDAESLSAGQRGAAVLAPTPFYAESGGQVGDQGRLDWPGGWARIEDTQRGPAGGAYMHFLEIVEGELARAATVSATVDDERRLPTQRNHTGTHLLHAALRHVLGEGVRQAGSLVAPDRLRFDFTHGRPMSAEEIARVERIVNHWVLEAQPVEISPDRDYEEAVAAGAMALFGEKYGDRVRTVSVAGGVGSLELCGGCHVANTGEIGPLLIVSERGVASGVRRIEALTGNIALDYLRQRSALLTAVGTEMGVGEERLSEEIRALKERTRELEKEVSQARMRVVSDDAGDQSVEVAGIKLLVREVPPAPPSELRSMADVLRAKLGSGVVVLGSRGEGKVGLVVSVTSDLTARIAAGAIVGDLAPMVGGGGGGRPDFAQAGGRQPEKLDAALAAAPEVVTRLLG